MEVALAAVNLAHGAIGGPDDEEDIPDVVVSAPSKERTSDRPPQPKPARRRGKWARDDSALRQPGREAGCGLRTWSGQSLARQASADGTSAPSRSLGASPSSTYQKAPPTR